MKLMKLISILALVFASGFAFAAAPGKIQVGAADGTVIVATADGAQKQLVAGDVLQENTTVSTSGESKAKIVLGNGTVILLDPNTTIDVSQFQQNDPSAVEGQDFASFSAEPEATSGSRTTIRLVKGKAAFKVAKLLPSSQLSVKTRVGYIHVKGTTFTVSDDGSHVTTSVAEGEVSIAPINRATIPLASGRAVSIPVAENGAGTPRYRALPATESKEILNAFAGDGPSSSDSPVRKDADAVSGADTLDPEIPDYAKDSDVRGPDTGYLNSPSSVGN